jgi:alkanesulfonate monooxygenase SsuD/methylene tetrahydromethanopterin reductase-like flavin-dependent oxidoreductase (luciferase family)
VYRARGEHPPFQSPQDAAAYPYTPVDRDRIARHREQLAVGAIDDVHKRLVALAEATRADELMITTNVFDHAARRRSYELLAEAFALAPAA